MPGGNCPPGIFFAISASCSGDGIPEPKPIAFASPASGPRFAPPIIFIMSAMPRCIFSSLLIASGVVPEPAAIRFLRLAFRMSGLRRSRGRHRIDDGDLPFDYVFVDVGRGELIFHFADAGQHAHEPAKAAHSLHLRELLAQVTEIERALAHFLGSAHRFLGIDIGRGLFDQRNDIAHAENTAGNPSRIELLEGIQFFARADELDWFAGDGAHG